MNQRDLIGYGPNPPVVQWPNGAKIAISVVVNYEEGSEYSLLDGDAAHEVNNEVPSPVPLDQRDLANESFFEYGSRVGVWRILNILDEYDVKSTFFCCALALERNPQLGPELVRRGHEIFGHGYRWEEHFKMGEEEEREAIRKTVESLQRTTGERPLGWYTRYAHGENTRRLVIEEGGFEYDSMAYNDDLPYYTEAEGRKWLVVPYSLETNDTRFWRGNMVSPDDFYLTLKNTFDLLYAEGATHPKMMNIGLHCRIIGRPSRAAALRQFFEYTKGFPDVWFAKRIEIARWWKEKFPA